ncbi:FHA domain-containing protein [Streptomyces sp. NPDC007325]|uniref:FHA domain-containing protein n=1 Tax=Streptomyces sp. NPDC007325 TaxID=3154588 RepID=UPI0033C4B808
MAPYCEECRWNFLTGTATSYTPIAPANRPAGPPPAAPAAPAAPAPPRDPFGYHDSRPSQVNRPAEPLGAEPTHHQAPPPYAAQAPAPPQPRADDDWVLSPPSQAEPPRPQGWTAHIGPDRDYFMAMMRRSGPEASGLNLPAYAPPKQLPLQGNQVSIGRRRHSTGEAPDIDLAVPPEDPGVSHQHAVLVQQPDGSWAVVDQNSTNGTTVNGGEEPIQPYVPVQLQDGDRVHVGAWTTITVRRG